MGFVYYMVFTNKILILKESPITAFFDKQSPSFHFINLNARI